MTSVSGMMLSVIAERSVDPPPPTDPPINLANMFAPVNGAVPKVSVVPLTV